MSRVERGLWSRWLRRRVAPREGSLGRARQSSLTSRVERGLRSRWLRRRVAPGEGSLGCTRQLPLA
eukprot:scaffold39730_cov320-Isochrysis_galbana.AAC.1